MAATIERMNDAPDGCRPSIRLPSFETLEQSRAEDKGRRSRALKTAAAFPVDTTRLNRLARRLARRNTLASAVRMRRNCDRVISNLYKLCREDGLGKHLFVTLTRTAHIVTIEQLASRDPRLINQGLRMDLRSDAANPQVGWAFGYLEGEFNPRTGKVQLHHHIIAHEDMLPAVLSLRKMPKYKSTRALSGRDDVVARPVHIRRIKPGQYLRTLTYTMKRYWHARWSGFDADGNTVRAKQTSRIPEPTGTEVLLWLDRWSLADVALLINIRATNNGFARVQSPSRIIGIHK